MHHIAKDFLSLPNHIIHHPDGWGNLSFIQIIIAINLSFHSRYFLAKYIRKFEKTGKKLMSQAGPVFEIFKRDRFLRSQLDRHQHQNNPFLRIFDTIWGGTKSFVVFLLEVLEGILNLFLWLNPHIYKTIITLSWISISICIALLYYNHSSLHSWLMISIWPIYMIFLLACLILSKGFYFILSSRQPSLSLKELDEKISSARLSEK